MVDEPAPPPPAALEDPAPPIRLVVLYGGQSAEHDVSRISARHVVAAASGDRYVIEPIAITKQGEWIRADEIAAAIAGGDELPESLPVVGTRVDPVPAIAAPVAAPPAGTGPTVVFPLLHGPMGEDGTVQGLLEIAGLPYVGCGVLSSALAMDKAKAKELFSAQGIPQARYRAFHERDVRAVGTGAYGASLADDLSFPIFVKPANMGSSIGVSKARDHDELARAIDLALTYDEWLVAEEGVQGREIECAVLGNLEPRASLPGEVVPGADFYDYEDKYFDGTAVTRIPAVLDEKEIDEVRTLAVEAYRALRCEGMARVDFFYEQPGRGWLVNEINTIPGFTPISMYPKMWEATGLSYPDLIDELVRLALDRHERRQAKRRTD